jgi:hypothetical protein
VVVALESLGLQMVLQVDPSMLVRQWEVWESERCERVRDFKDIEILLYMKSLKQWCSLPFKKWLLDFYLKYDFLICRTRTSTCFPTSSGYSSATA